MRLSLIVAMAANRVIGRDGQLPWQLPGELERFKRVTMGHAKYSKVAPSVPGAGSPVRATVRISTDTSARAAGANAMPMKTAIAVAQVRPNLLRVVFMASLLSSGGGMDCEEKIWPPEKKNALQAMLRLKGRVNVRCAFYCAFRWAGCSVHPGKQLTTTT